jgi:hypothetical protein
MLPKDLSHLTIRSATNADRERVAELVFGVLAEYGLEPDPETTDADLQNIEANYLERGGLFEIIEDGGNMPMASDDLASRADQAYKLDL